MEVLNMPNWTESMQQTFEYYTVDPGTWGDKDKLEHVKSSSIVRDSTAATLGSASIDLDDPINEEYIRTYLVTNQNDVIERIPLGTHLTQTLPTSFDGKVAKVSTDAYTPLIELKENPPPIGYTILAGKNIMKTVSMLCREHLRAPVAMTDGTIYLETNFTADTDEMWLDYLIALMAKANYTFDLDEMGRVLFAPEQDIATLQSVWTYDDGNSSILLPDVDFERDLYGIPNVIEVVCTTNEGPYVAIAVNNNAGSPISTVSRGREITKRISNPELPGVPTKDKLDRYAQKVLQSLSSLEYTITYSHGYCPVRLGDCVLLNYERAGLQNVKAKVIKQTIKCEAGCTVTETAVFTKNLWR